MQNSNSYPVLEHFRNRKQSAGVTSVQVLATVRNNKLPLDCFYLA